MKRALILLTSLLAAAALAYGLSRWYFVHGPATPPQANDAADPLLWLQRDLGVDPYTLARVKAAHKAYQPQCASLCLAIAKANARVRTLMEQSRAMTPELETAIRDAQQCHADCRTAMLRHIYETAALLPPDAAAPYLHAVTGHLVAEGVCIDEVMEKNP